jgi:hypothetical protein
MRIFFSERGVWGSQAGGDVQNSTNTRTESKSSVRKFARWITESFGSNRRAKPDIHVRILNITRQTEIASCVEVADRGAKRRKGLLERKGLSPEEGLWIVPCEAIHTIGMQFPIDLVYLGRDNRVKKVRNSVPPWRLSACLSAHSVLELAPGTVHRTQTRPGDRLELSSVSSSSNCSSVSTKPQIDFSPRT